MDFRGGLNLDAAPDNLADNELMVANNIDLDERGAVNKRKGVRPLVRREGILPAQSMHAPYDTFVLDAGASAVDGAYVGNWISITSGTGRGQARHIIAYTGATKTVQVSASFDAPLDAGSNYEIIYRYISEVEQLIEWPRNDGTKVLLAMIGLILTRLDDDGKPTNIITLDEPSIGWFSYQDKFYFTGKQGGTSKYWFYDGSAVAEVVPHVDATNDLTPIKRCREFIWHPKSMRVFATKDPNDPTALYYSQSGDPTFFKSTSKLFPTTGDGPTYGLTVFGDSTIVWYQTSAWAWKGVDPNVDAEWIKLPVGYGTTSSATVRMTPNSLTFYSLGSLYSMSPGMLDYSMIILTGDELVKNRAQDKVTSLLRKVTNPTRTCAVFDKINERYIFAFSITPGAVRNDLLLVLDWGLQSYVLYTGIKANDMIQRADGTVLVASKNYVLRLNQETFADWDVDNNCYKAINMEFHTKHYNLDHPFNEKKFRRLFLGAKQYDTSESSIDIQIKLDYQFYELTALSLDAITLDESFVWGNPWGNPWGWSELITKQAKLRGKGSRVQLIGKNNLMYEPVTFYACAFEFRLKRPKGVKV